jgi:hypothetical protein
MRSNKMLKKYEEIYLFIFLTNKLKPGPPFSSGFGDASYGSAQQPAAAQKQQATESGGNVRFTEVSVSNDAGFRRDVIDPFRAALLDKQLADICQLVLFFCFFC